MLENNNNKLQNKITTLIIIVATIFILFANTETNLEKIYPQEDGSNTSIELTAKLVNNEYRWDCFQQFYKSYFKHYIRSRQPNHYKKYKK